MKNVQGMSMQQMMAAYEREIAQLRGVIAKIQDDQKDGHFMEDLTVAAVQGLLTHTYIVLERMDPVERATVTNNVPTARQIARAAIHQAEAVMIEISQLMMKADAESAQENESKTDGEGTEQAEEPSMIIPP